MRAWTVFLALALMVALAVAACGDESGTSGGDVGAAGVTNGAGGSGGSTFSVGGNMNTSLLLDPPSHTIEVVDGVSAPVTFTATMNGNLVYPTSWSVDLGTIATVDSSGNVAATNVTGGAVKVRAELDGAFAEADVYVNFKKTVNPGNIPQEQMDLLRNATDPDGQIVWAYPYDGTVWPQGLLPPELMWNQGGSGDLYYFKLTGQYVELEIFTAAEPPSRYPLTPEDWIAVNEAGGGSNGDTAVHGARLAAGAPAATVMIDHNWRMARGSLRGTVYYWANNLGRVVRIKPGEEAPEDFLAANGITQCSACHTVSADGLTLVLGGDTPVSNYDLLNDQVVLQLGSVGKGVRNWAMPAVSPDGRFVVENNEQQIPGPPGGSPGLWDAATGTEIPGSGLDGVFLNMPTFGPKGHKLAYVDPSTKNLRVYDFDLMAGTVSNPQLLVEAGGDPGLSGICYPNIGPSVNKGEGADETYVVYHRGTYPGSLDTRYGPGHIYMASADVPGKEWRLAAINGDAYPFAAGDRDRGNNYEPTFAPQASGGYMWVVFTSRRTYGNRLTGSEGQVKQLWVAAVDLFPEDGVDPSYPAFWVPGQDLNTLNMRGFWALDPCIQDGNACTTDDDCCDGSACEDGVCGGAETCVELGGACDDSADCCDPEALCIGGECAYQGPA